MLSIKIIIKKILNKLHLKFVRSNQQIKISSFFFLKLIDNLNIIDLGSENYSGEIDSSYKDLISTYKSNIYCFDFLGNKSLNSLRGKVNFNFIQEAVYDGSQVNFYECIPQSASGIYPPAEDWLARLGCPTSIKNIKKVQSKKLDDLIPKEISVDLIKLDIQGAEIVALENAADTLKNVSFVQCEANFTELFIGSPLFPEVYNFMKSKGFNFYSFSSLGLFSLDGVERHVDNGDPRFYHSHFWSRQLAWSIAIFYRDPKYFKNEPQKILNAAAIAHTTYNAYDLTRSILAQGADFIPNGEKILKDYELILAQNSLI